MYFRTFLFAAIGGDIIVDFCCPKLQNTKSSHVISLRID